MDKIILRGLQVFSLIGVYDFEREAQQALLVDVTMTLDLHRAAESDDVNDTVDYAAIAKRLESLAADSEFELLEALANRMIETLLNDYPLLSVTLAITKPGILPNAQQVTVELTREA